jgi:hypothetical protein
MIKGLIDSVFGSKEEVKFTTNDETTSKILVAVDYSGSTGGCANYWDAVSNIVSNVIPKGANTNYLLWDSSYVMVDFNKLIDNCKKRTGNGGTSPDEVLKYMTKTMPGEEIVLHLFTDGQVGQGNVAACDALIKKHEISFKKVYVHFYNTGGAINLSVSAPFTRKCAFEIYIDGKSTAEGNSREEVDLRQWEDLTYFLENYEKLRGNITMQNLGIMNNDLRNQLLELKKKLLAAYVKRGFDSTSEKPLMNALNSGDYARALNEVNSLVVAYQSKMDGPKLIEKAIGDMITACTSPGNFSFDLIKGSRAERADMVTDMPAEQVEEVLASEKTFECPIMLDTDVPALLIAKPQLPILAGLEKDVVDDIINCPLNLWKYNDLVVKVAELLDHPVGCQSLKGGLFETSPLTRRELVGAVTLGAADDHCKATNWTLAQVFSGGKLLGNPDLWTVLVYYIAKKRVNYLSENEELMNSFGNHLKYRLMKHKTNLGLSGLPDFPLIKVPVGAALWYCVASGDIYAEKNHAQDRLRAFGGIGEIFVHMLDVLGLPYDKEYTHDRLKLLRVFGWMMSQKLNKAKLVDLIRSYYQNHIYLVGKERFIFLDGPEPAERNPKAPTLPEFTQGIPFEVLVTLSNLIDPLKKSGDVIIEKYVAPTRIHFKKNYGYPTNWNKEQIFEKEQKVKICPLTFRPYFIDPVKNKHWELCVEETWECPLDKMISLKNYYIRFVIENLKFPTREELIEYLYDKQRNKESNAMDTLPQYAEIFVDHMILNMEAAMKAHHEKLGVEVTPEKFKQIVERSRSRELREQIEKEWK